jgi:hypothetical protein
VNHARSGSRNLPNGRGASHLRFSLAQAGLRLAALSLAGHPDPGRFAAEFSGSERTVTEYLLAEVLERQSEEVRSLLLRTSVLEQVNGEFADLLTGGTGSERILQDLEQAGAFVVSLDARRSWFRYHQMFADLLELELRRTAPEGVTCCMPPRPTGSPGTGIRWRRSATPRPHGTGTWRLACCRTAGSAWRWTLPSDQPLGAGDRQRTVPVGKHRPDAHAAHIRKARRARPNRGRRASPRPGPAGAFLAPARNITAPRRVATPGPYWTRLPG